MGDCSLCGRRNPDGTNVCLDCGTLLITTCPACGQDIPVATKVCDRCGAPIANQQLPPAVPLLLEDEVGPNLPASGPVVQSGIVYPASIEPYGQRREVTVLVLTFTSLAAVTKLPNSTDSSQLMSEAIRHAEEIVYKYEGSIQGLTGTGLTALFGSPVTHEDDPERAIRTALEIQPELQLFSSRLQQKFGLHFQVRIGINTGPVITTKVSSALPINESIFGDTADLATFLGDAAKPGTILVSLETHQRTQTLFRFEPVTSLSRKGMLHPIQAFEVLGLRIKRIQSRSLIDIQIPLIGRARELARLQETVTKVHHDGSQKTVLITGEAGLGKSRLVAEFVKSFATLTFEAKVHQGSCLAYAQSRPLWVVAEILRNTLHLSEQMPEYVQHETLKAHLDRLNLKHDEVLPYLVHLLGLKQPSTKFTIRLQLLDPAILQKQTHAALRQLFLAESRVQPTVLVFEDLHWVDPASRDFLEYLIRTTSDSALMLILVSRQAERETVIRPLIAASEQNPGQLVDLPLQALPDTEAALLVDQFLPQTTSSAQNLKQWVVGRAEGNPFFLEEIVRMLIDKEILTKLLVEVRQPVESSSWELYPHVRELLRTVPGTVRELILARFDSLPGDLKWILQQAAVVGSNFPVNLLHGLSNVGLEVLTTQLNELAGRQFLIVESYRTEAGYAFQHALTQEVIYNTLLKRDRRKHHTRVAQIVEQSAFWPPEEQTELLAYHYSESTLPTLAIPYLIAVAERAARNCAYETAIEHYRRAMNLLPVRPDQAGDEFFRVRTGLGRSLKYVGEFTEATQHLSEAIEHLWEYSLLAKNEDLWRLLIDSLRQLADVRQREGNYDPAMAYLEAALHVLGEEGASEYPRLWRSILDRMAWIYFRQGKLEKSYSLATTATEGVDPTETDDPIRLASLYNTMGGVSWQSGNRAEAIEYVKNSLQLYRSLGYSWGMAVAYGNLGLLHDVLGNWLEAAEFYERAYALQQDKGDLEGQARSLNNLGFLRMVMGEHDTALHSLQTGWKLGQQIGDNWITAQAEVSLAQLAVIQQRFEDAADRAQAALSLSEIIGSSEIQIQARWILALAQAGNNDQISLESAGQALQMAHETNFREGELDSLRVLGVLHTRAGEYLEAEIKLRQSVDLAHKQKDPYRHGQALLELGRMYQHLASDGTPPQMDYKTQAETSLTEAARQFETLGAAYDLQLAQAALSQIQTNTTE